MVHTHTKKIIISFYLLFQVYIFMLMWFQIFNGFSGITMVDDLNLMFFNLIYTSLPPIMFGALDQCVSDELLMRFPQLYKRGPRDEVGI